MQRNPTISALLAVICLSACCSAPPRKPPVDPARYNGLPGDTAALITFSDKVLARRPMRFKEVDRALAALEKALKQVGPRRFEVYWKLARACFLLTEILPTKQQRLIYGRQGRDYAGWAAALKPKRAEGHYYRALNIAKVAEATSDRKKIKAMVAEAEIAARQDPRLDEAGPLRFLGKVYITAPAWPVSVGSSEKALEYLERAVSLAPTPLNRLFLGEAYYHEEEYDKARATIRKALEDGKSGALDRRWLEEGREYLERIRLEGLPES